MTATLERAPAPGRSGLRRGLVALVVVVLLGVVAVVALGRADRRDDRPLSPTSTGADGSRALARLLAARGVDVRETGSLADARGGGTDRTVLVLDPRAYTADALAALVAGTTGPVVLLQPDDAALTAVGADLVTVTDNLGVGGEVAPGCTDPAATAAGPVEFDAAVPYAGPRRTDVCYNGAFARDDRIAVLGDSSLLTNTRLADTGVAALTLNLLGSTSELVWVRPGAGADTGPTGSVWTALPDHAETAALWALGVGLLLVLWRGRRLGAPLPEPLPVVVRADEIVRGRGRLYERGGETARAAAALRDATLGRVRRSLALAPSAPAAEVEREAARHLGTPLPPGLLDGGAPVDGDGLLALARDLAELEDRVKAVGSAVGSAGGSAGRSSSRGPGAGRAGWTP